MKIRNQSKLMTFGMCTLLLACSSAHAGRTGNGTSFNGIGINGAAYQGSTLQGTTLQGAKLQGSSMQGRDYQGADAPAQAGGTAFDFGAMQVQGIRLQDGETAK